jgi:hypothetical protein
MILTRDWRSAPSTGAADTTIIIDSAAYTGGGKPKSMSVIPM